MEDHVQTNDQASNYRGLCSRCSIATISFLHNIYIYIYIYICVCVCVCVCIYIYIYLYACILHVLTSCCFGGLCFSRVLPAYVGAREVCAILAVFFNCSWDVVTLHCACFLGLPDRVRYIYIYIYICIYICISVYMCVYISIFLCIIYIYIYLFIYFFSIYIYIYILAKTGKGTTMETIGI